MSQDSMRPMTCCFTEHRSLAPWEQLLITRRLARLLPLLAAQGVRYFGVGGALGFDTLAAQAVLKLRQNHGQIKLILVLPCADQAQKWSASDIQTYESIKIAADKVTCLSPAYVPGCMYKRNRHLVDHSGVCVCYLRKASGGTAYTVRYARQQGIPVWNVANRIAGNGRMPSLV